MTQNQKTLLVGAGLFTVAAVAGGSYWYFGIYRPAKKASKDNEDAAVAASSVLNVPITAPAVTIPSIGSTTTPSIPKPAPAQVSAFDALPVGSFPIALGQKSKLAYILQTALNYVGNHGLKVDGDFGNKTKEALKKEFNIESVANKNQALTIIQKVQAKKKANADAGNTANFLTSSAVMNFFK